MAWKDLLTEFLLKFNINMNSKPGERLNELERLELRLKLNRDFERLLDLHVEALTLDGSITNRIKRIPQKAYCLARLGRKDEANKALKEMRGFEAYINMDQISGTITLLTFFMMAEPHEFGLMELNTIKNWLKHPVASKLVEDIVFDYSDFVGNVKPFNYARLQTKQTYFSEELLECVFAAMGRNNDTKIYYNRETNDVQQEVEGYLTSHMTSDQSAENRRLANRIMNSDSTDSIIDGLHFLIPRLPLLTFLEKFKEYADDKEQLIEFTDEFESTMMEKYGDYVGSVEDLVFSEGVSISFFAELDKWCRNNHFDIYELKEIINMTRNAISTEFLIDVNEE